MNYKLIISMILAILLAVGCSGSPTHPDPPDDNLTLNCRVEGIDIEHFSKIGLGFQYRRKSVLFLLTRIVYIDFREIPANTTGEPMFPDFTIDELTQWIAWELALSMRDSCNDLYIWPDQWDYFYFHSYSLAQIIYKGENMEKGGLLYAFRTFYTPEQIEGIAMTIAGARGLPYKVVF